MNKSQLKNGVIFGTGVWLLAIVTTPVVIFASTDITLVGYAIACTVAYPITIAAGVSIQ